MIEARASMRNAAHSAASGTAVSKQHERDSR